MYLEKFCVLCSYRKSWLVSCHTKEACITFFAGDYQRSWYVQLSAHGTEWCQTLALNYLCKLTVCTFNVQPGNLHNSFSCLKDHDSIKVTSLYIFLTT